MGFFGRLFGKKSDSDSTAAPSTDSRVAPKQTFGPHRLIPWNQNPYSHYQLLPCDDERKIFVYDSGPYKQVETGRTIELVVYPGEAQMTSTANRAKGQTDESGNVCLLYRGRPVGFTRIPRDLVQQVDAVGIRLALKATVGEELKGYRGIRALTGHTPFSTRKYLEGLIRNEKAVEAGIPRHSQMIEYNEWDEEDFVAIADKDHWDFPDARLEALPVPQGSKAKPHIAIRGADGTLISQLNGRSRAYKEVAAALQSSNRFHVKAEFVGSRKRGDVPGFRINLWHWSE